MADIQELLARLGAPSNAPPPQYQPSVSSPIHEPTPSGPQPHHASAVLSPNLSTANTPVSEHPGLPQTTQQQEQSVQLLNLLRFNSQPGVAQVRRPSQNTQPSDNASVQSRAVSASDLVASFTGGKASYANPSSTLPAAPRPEPASLPASNPQDILMRLLNHPKPSQTKSPLSRSASAAPFSPATTSHMPETAVGDVTQHTATKTYEEIASQSIVDPLPAQRSAAPPMRVFGFESDETVFKPEASAPPAEPAFFTYRNPFEQLEAASPRNRTPAPGPKMEILKPKHALDGGSLSGGEESNQPALKAQKLSPPSVHEHETVAEAVNDLGEQVGKEIEEALARAEDDLGAEAAAELEQMSPEDIEEIQEAVVQTAVEIKKELEDEDNVKQLESMVPKPIADSLKQVANEIAEDVADSWESVEDTKPGEEEQTVIVYTFPMKAFTSIAVKDMPAAQTFFSQDLVMDVARLKKEFDQIDRSLVSATKSYIVYAMTKRGGFRIIRQETGQYRQVFENHQERLFNVALCVGGEESTLKSTESILGIGVHGSVFWAAADRERDIDFDDLDNNGLILPPSPSQDDNTSGGQLKTRAKPSSRHPEFFAVGRGKAIHIIWPQLAANYVRSKSRIVDTEKYLKEKSLKILTGKAGKDFTFSEDDTVIVSLDKAGRMRFWDIRPLTKVQLGDAQESSEPVEVSQTMLEFHTTSANAKSWPTSVFFFDKDKAYRNGIASRYVMVGMKQNHAFQLWDLALGKAVQEINLPHEKESDAICSVGFHPRSGIMVIAHPTRNSIFFIHISCPRYVLPIMSQATYISRVVNKTNDRSMALPPVNATAIMTSITEYSFAPKGQIRSLHLLHEPSSVPEEDPENPALFELYVMHSKGVTNLRIRRSDLGWKKEGEPLHPKQAEAEGLINVSMLKPTLAAVDESTTSGDTPGPKSVSDRPTREIIKKDFASRQSMTPEAAMRASTLAKVESKQDAARAALINGSEKPEKKKKKRAAAETASQVSSVTRAAPSYAQAAQGTPRSKSPEPSLPVESTPSTMDQGELDLAKQLIGEVKKLSLDTKELVETVPASLVKQLSQSTDALYKRIDDDKRASHAQQRADQEALLRIVSSTLNDNIEGVMRQMVEENVRQVLLPSIVTQISSSVEQHLSNTAKTILAPRLAKEIPAAVTQSLKSPQLFQSLSDQVAKKVTGNVEQVTTAAVSAVITPLFSNLAGVIDQKIGNQLQQAQLRQHDDAAKIHQLTETVQTCLQTIQAMAATQADLQGQVLKMQQHLSQIAPPKTPEDSEVEELTRLMAEGQYEQGTMRWVQSPRANELFDKVFIRCDPNYLRQVSPLLVLSTGAIVTNTLKENLAQRLMWLDTVLRSINPNDNEIKDVTPKILDVIRERLAEAYMRLNENAPGDPSLRNIAALVKRAGELSRASFF